MICVVLCCVVLWVDDFLDDGWDRDRSREQHWWSRVNTQSTKRQKFRHSSRPSQSVPSHNVFFVIPSFHSIVKSSFLNGQLFLDCPGGARIQRPRTATPHSPRGHAPVRWMDYAVPQFQDGPRATHSVERMK
jgi:hypothetical protein